MKNIHSVRSSQLVHHFSKLFFLILSIWLYSCVGNIENKIDKEMLRTKVVLLGTGTPNADPDRSGPSVAVVVDNTPYIIDCGPGVVRRAAAARQIGIGGLDPEKLNVLFITHLHSDHTIGYPDFLFTPAVLERTGPVQVFGPPGIHAMTDHILAAYQQDITIRIFGLEKGNAEAYKANVSEIDEGVVYTDSLVKVTAYRVKHGSWQHAFAYRFDTVDRSVVISGDCTYDEKLIEACNGCDVLVHEVYSEDGYSRRPEKWKRYHADFHTSSTDLARLAVKAKPKKLVLYHQLIWDSTEEKLIDEIRSIFNGEVISGRDLDII